jgi:hypothetical protein
MEEKILKEVFDFFIKSKDFNGIPITTISDNLKLEYLRTIEVLKSLLNKNLISVQSSINPHIISLGNFPLEVEKNILENAKNNVEKTMFELNDIKIKSSSHLVCVYPSQKYLTENRNVNEFQNLPYSEKLALAEPHLKPIFFEIEVLERYFKDPRYSFEFEDYSGKISYELDEDNKPLVKEKDKIFLKTFGLGQDINGNRIAVAYLRYLKGLTSEHQIYWKSKELDSKNCIMLKEYYENTIAGNWTNSYSIFSAFIEEQKVVNDLSFAIFNKSLFSETFENNKRPKEFTFFMIPTLENYHNFISLLDKMISDNINRNFFEGKIELFEFKKIDETLSERINKGTLRLLEEWLSNNYNFEDIDKAKKILFEPFKKVRKERQSPAHKINSNFYDKTLVEKQKEIISQCYQAMKNLRHIFKDHRKAKDVKTPEWLDNGEIKTF